MTTEEFKEHVEAAGCKAVFNYNDDSFQVAVIASKDSAAPYLIHDKLYYDDDISRNQTRSNVCDLLIRRILACGLDTIQRTSPTSKIYDIFKKPIDT